MDTVDEWFKREVYAWRTGASVCWSMLAQPFILLMFLGVCKIQVLHPVSWIIDLFSHVLSLDFALTSCIMMGLAVAYYLMTVSSYRVTPDIAPTRLHALGMICSPTRIVTALAYMLLGSVMAWIFTNSVGGRYAFLSSAIPNSELWMLNEYHLFLVVYGMFVGAMFYVNLHIGHLNYMQFPCLQQAKFFQVRSSLYTVLHKSFWTAATLTLYFYGLYWLFGHIPRDLVLIHNNVKLADYQLNSLLGMLDLCLLFQTIACGTYLLFTWTLCTMLHKIFITEHYAFPIENAFQEKSSHLLADALNCQKSDLVQYLGFYDLCHLSRNSVERRCRVFSLSQPGGHPHNWNKLYTACLKEIDELNQKVQDVNWKTFASVPVKKPCGDKNMPSADGDKTPINLTFRGNSQGQNGGQENNNKENQTKKSNLDTFKDLTIAYLKKKPLSNYLLSELPDAKTRKLFAASQLHVWAIEALSNFATASYSEDKYGVVQRALPEIIASMLNLQDNVEKHFKLSSTGARKNQKESGLSDSHLGSLLQNTLKCSIYKIVSTFDKHILSLNLSTESSRKLKLFIDFKE